MLAGLLRRKLEKEGISVREASRQIGIAHTTLARVLEGESLDLSTVMAVSRWIGVSPADVLHGEGKLGSLSELSAQVATLLQASPRLGAIFDELLRKFEEGVVSSDTVEDIIAYATYRLGMDMREDVVERALAVSRGEDATVSGSGPGNSPGPN